MKEYLYKEYYDDDAYGEEITAIFPNRQDAVNHLKERVEKHFDIPFELIPTRIKVNNDDTLKEDYVSVYDGSGYRFWIVEEKEVIGETRVEWHLRNAIEELRKMVTESYDGELIDMLGITSDEAIEYGITTSCRNINHFSKSVVADVVKDINSIIKKQGKDELRYSLPSEEELVVEVLSDFDGDDLFIEVARYDRDRHSIKCIRDDYECSDEMLSAMVESCLINV